MQELKQLDQVAYVRFASVYRDFRDVDDFVQRSARAARAQGVARHRGHRQAPELGVAAGRQAAGGAALRGGRSATTRR